MKPVGSHSGRFPRWVTPMPWCCTSSSCLVGTARPRTCLPSRSAGSDSCVSIEPPCSITPLSSTAAVIDRAGWRHWWPPERYVGRMPPILSAPRSVQLVAASTRSFGGWSSTVRSGRCAPRMSHSSVRMACLCGPCGTWLRRLVRCCSMACSTGTDAGRSESVAAASSSPCRTRRQPLSAWTRPRTERTPCRLAPPTRLFGTGSTWRSTSNSTAQCWHVPMNEPGCCVTPTAGWKCRATRLQRARRSAVADPPRTAQ